MTVFDRAAWQREWRAKCKAEGREYDRGHRERNRRNAKNPRERQQSTATAHAAHARVARAIRAGRLVRPDVCAACGGRSCDVGKIEAAHYTYTEPLRVRWLCRSCHAQWDHDEPKGGAQ